ncbi:MAG: GerMN domain-containing protein [Nitrospirae bacterium]|nr:GerMN domain-containing protein [Nitrospirota bacterium]
MNIRKLTGLLLLAAVFLAGVIGGYLYFSKFFYKERTIDKEPVQTSINVDDFFSLRIYYPVYDHLQFEERRILKRSVQIAIAEAAVEEYLKGPAGITSQIIPKETKLLDLYKGVDKILYIDLSEEFRRNFQGDVLAEFLLLKGLYESIISNVEDVQDVKVIIEGREIETHGGHFYLLYPLKDTVSLEFK